MNLTALKKKVEKEIPKIAEKFASQTEQMFLVGGALRDILFEKKPKDFDFVISDINGAKSFFEKERVKFFTIEKEDFVFLRVVLKYKTLDFIEQKKPLIEDIHERDFTINTVFYNVKTKDLIGSNEAFSDIEDRILRVASEDSIEKDPLRVLRGIRFVASFRLKVEKRTLEKMREGFALLKNVSADRKHEEMRKLFSIEFEKLSAVFEKLFSKNCFAEKSAAALKLCREFGTDKIEMSKGISLVHLCKLYFIASRYRLSPLEIFGATKREAEFIKVLENAECDFEYFFNVFEKYGADFALASNIARCNGEKADKIVKWKNVKIDGNKLQKIYGVSGKALGALKREKIKEECRKVYEEKI